MPSGVRSVHASESDVLAAAMQFLHWSPEVVAWRANTGGARPEDSRVLDAVLGMLKRGENGKAIAQLHGYAKKRGQRVRFGPVGQADIMGYFTAQARHVPHGTILALEVKRHDGKPAADKLSPEQAAFLQAISDAGGIAAVIDDVSVLPAVISGAHCDPCINEPPF